MDLVIVDGEIFHVKASAGFGIADHMHVCLKIGNEYVILLVCTSQGDTVYNLIQSGEYEPGTFVQVSSDSVNNFVKTPTFINCNEYWKFSEDELADFVRNNDVYTHNNKLSSIDLRNVIEGLQKSPKIERKIKKQLAATHKWVSVQFWGRALN